MIVCYPKILPKIITKKIFCLRINAAIPTKLSVDHLWLLVQKYNKNKPKIQNKKLFSPNFKLGEKLVPSIYNIIINIIHV